MLYIGPPVVESYSEEYNVITYEEEKIMKISLLSLLVGTALMAAATIPQAEEVLNNSQLDRVAAGIKTSSSASTSTANNGGSTSTSSGGYNGAFSMGVVTPALGGPTYIFISPITWTSTPTTGSMSVGTWPVPSRSGSVISGW